MLYDLNIPWSSTIDPLELKRTIFFLSELGYHTIALNYILNGPIPSQIVNPIPENLPFAPPPKTTILRRCTLVLKDPKLNHRLPQLSAAFDILAIRPTNSDSFDAACLNIAEISIISLDLTQRYPFHFKPKPLMAAVNRGIKFEISYAQATMEDKDARRNVISNCMGIFRATRGRGIIISSEAKIALGLRGPADVVNLMEVWGLARERGTEALNENPRGVVVNEGLKRTSYRGVVDIVYGGEKHVPQTENEPASKKSANTNVNTAEKGKGKRVAEEKELKGDEAPQMSKRQAKRMRIEALKAAGASSNSNPSSKENSPAKDTPSPLFPDTHSTIKAKANS